MWMLPYQGITHLVTHAVTDHGAARCHEAHGLDSLLIQGKQRSQYKDPQ